MANKDKPDKSDKKDTGALNWCARLFDLCRKGNFKSGVIIHGADEGEANANKILAEYETWRGQQ